MLGMTRTLTTALRTVFFMSSSFCSALSVCTERLHNLATTTCDAEPAGFMCCENNESFKTHSAICNSNNPNGHLFRLQINQYFLSPADDFNQLHKRRTKQREMWETKNWKLSAKITQTYALFYKYFLWLSVYVCVNVIRLDFLQWWILFHFKNKFSVRYVSMTFAVK